MITRKDIEQTIEYVNLKKNTPFIDDFLFKKHVLESIERIIYQIKKFGLDYISDKNYSEREVKIAKQIIENEISRN